MAYDPATQPAVPPLGEAADPALDPFARHEELLAEHQQAYSELMSATYGDSRSGERRRAADEREFQLFRPALDNLFDRMHAQGMVQVADDGAEIVQLHAPHESPNAGHLTFTRGGAVTDGVVMTFAENPFTGWEGDRVQRGHSLMYDLTANKFRPFNGGPKFTSRGLSSEIDVSQWVSNILQGRTDSEFAADEIADQAALVQQRQEAAERRAAEVAASLQEIEDKRRASMLGSLSLGVMRARRRHRQNYGA